MDERKTVIRELEDKKRALMEKRNRLLTDLGETLIQKIGEKDDFPSDGSPGMLLAEYRKLQMEIAEASNSILSLEADIQRLKELEDIIIAKEGEHSLLTEEQEQVNIRLGMALLEAPDLNDSVLVKKKLEEGLLTKIEEHEKDLEELEEQKSGIFSWLGKNAKIAVEKALLAKSRSDLQKLYRTTGEEFSAVQADIPEGDVGEIAKKAFQLKEFLASLSEELTALKGERRKIGGVFGTESAPSRRIQGFEKQIANKRKEIPVVYLKFGSLAAASDGKEVFSAFLKEGDLEILQEAEKIASQVDETELEIKKIKAAIEIDREKVEIEKLEKAVLDQRRKITAAEEAIGSFEIQIAEAEKSIEKLKAFIQGENGDKNE